MSAIELLSFEELSIEILTVSGRVYTYEPLDHLR